MAIKVHGVPTSTATARALLCLCEMDLEYELVPVDLAVVAPKQQPHLSLNPFGQIPALDDGDIKVFESGAINRYLARKYKSTEADLLGSHNLVESANVETWMEVEARQFSSPISIIIQQIIANPIYGLPPDEQIIESEINKLEKILDVYEERLSKYKYLAGVSHTLADMHHIPHLVYFMRTPRATVWGPYPRVHSWWNDISLRPATLKVSAAMKFKGVYEIFRVS